MKLVQRPSPNQDARDGVGVDMLVLHYTGMTSGDAALARLCDPAARVSAHYAIGEDGTVYALVPEDRRAWHAGVSFWAGARDINARSIGIELVNPGHEFGYRAFPEMQIAALVALTRANSRAPRHFAIAGAGTQRCGARSASWTRANCFPGNDWPARGSACGPSEPAIRAKALFAGLLARYGYDPGAPLEKIVTAFQRHFRPSRVDGLADAETRQVLAGLLALCDAANG